MRAKITKRLLDSLTNDTGKDMFCRDTELRGFGAKITPSGSVTFIVEGRIRKGRSKRYNLGSYPALSVADARARAHTIFRLFRDGVDPHQQEQAELAAKSREHARQKALGVTLRDTMESFFKARRLKSEAGYRNVINNCFADWLDKPANWITRQSVEQRYQHLAFEKGVKAQAAKGMRYLRSIMNHAKGEVIEGERLIVDNPVDVLRDKKVDRTIKPRTRHIAPDQLFPFIRALITECTPTVRDVLLLILMSGLRDQEAKGLRWANVDFKHKTFTALDTKNKTDHTLPMGGFLYLMLLARYHTRTNDVWVFPNERGTDHTGDTRKQMARVTTKAGVAFTSHDLRRTFATLLNELSTHDLAIQRLMNHKPRNVTEHYIQTRAALYTEPMNNLHNLITFAHDWTDNAGQDGFEALLGTLDNEALARHQLFYVLYGDTLEALEAEGVALDWLYVDATYHPLHGISYEALDQRQAQEAEQERLEWEHRAAQDGQATEQGRERPRSLH